eukprot:NODE_4438_length_580_cov_121.177024_g3219_i0.p3 GENE.NODE_4438_length_580_cov_121.177024_g3219_i0~~NODE_4438_length_580_cov_121.177024_g3219_i0.p3  ORF type:complete len:85 (-),score=37.43 NODE_4438_length_580_cov_121.177024_g3219_i0:324-548(-)
MGVLRRDCRVDPAADRTWSRTFTVTDTYGTPKRCNHCNACHPVATNDPIGGYECDIQGTTFRRRILPPAAPCNQ